MVLRDGGPDIVFFFAIGVGSDIDTRDKFKTIEIAKARNLACILRLRRIILVGQSPCGIEQAAHIGPAHIGPVRPLGAVKTDQ